MSPTFLCQGKGYIYMNSNDKKYEFVINYEYFMQINYMQITWFLHNL